MTIDANSVTTGLATLTGSGWDTSAQTKYPGDVDPASGAEKSVVVGNAAAGAADSGNPVKAGGKYNAALPTLADGNRGDLQLDASGRLRTSIEGVAGATPVVVGGTTTNPTNTITRPADTNVYASGRLVANSVTAGSVVFGTLTVARVAAGSFMLRRLKLAKSGTSVTNASFRVHLLRTAPVTVTNGDNGVLSISGVADYLGAFDVTIDRAFTDGAAGFGVPVIGSEMSIKLASGTTIVWVLEARAAYTPVSGETFTVTADDLQD